MLEWRPRRHKNVLYAFSLGGVSTGICKVTIFWFMLAPCRKFKLRTQIEHLFFDIVILWVFSCKKSMSKFSYRNM